MLMIGESNNLLDEIVVQYGIRYYQVLVRVNNTHADDANRILRCDAD